MRINIFFVAVWLCCSCNSGKETSSDEKPLLYLPDDLEATLWAESPMFYNPTNMDVDTKGRIWVTEAVNYRNYNNDSTKVLHHRKGDRVMILEDTDGDGKADNSKVFVQDKDLVSPLGIAVIGNKVFVSCSPNLIVYTDENGDDIPDKKEILLNGFGGRDHDHSLHSVSGGPDGNLYFNTGNAGPHVVTDRSGWTLRSGSVYTGGSPYNVSNSGNMKSDDGQVWVGGLALRMDQEGKGLKVLAHNFRNAYELAIDSRGDMWQNDNDDQVVACRTSWLMEGANAGYFSRDGTRYWQADQRPWQDVFSAHWHQDDPGVTPAGDNAGAGSPTGVVVNEGDALGPQYRGLLLSADAGRNVVFGYLPKVHKSGYDLGTRQNFITSLREDNVGYVWNDSLHNTQSEKWFRPSDVTIGTDGAIYVADWYDPVVGGHQMQDTAAYGRIYRIAPKDGALKRPILDLGTVAGQLEALRSPAVNVRATALQQLITAGDALIPEVRKLLKGENPYHQARAIWLLSNLGNAGLTEVEALLLDKNEMFRLVAFRALKQKTNDILPYARILENDLSPFVRREVIISLADVPYEKAKNTILELIDGYDGKDRWYLESIGTTLKGRESEIFPDLIKRYNATGKKSDQWDNNLSSLAWRLHPSDAVPALRDRALSQSLSDKERADAITALAFINTQAAVKAMITLSKSENKVVAEQAAYWVSFRQGNEWFALWDWSKSGIDAEQERRITAMKIKRSRILDEHMPLDEKKWNARDMSKDPTGAQMLLSLMSEKRIPEPLYTYVKGLILNNSDAQIRMQGAVFLASAGAEKKYAISAISEMKKHSPAGKNIFLKQCSGCHRVEKRGNNIGPDISAINKKLDRESLLNAIINPDAGIVFGYEGWTITLADGQSFFGFLLADGPETITIKDLAGKNHVIPVASISARKKQEKSLMPPAHRLGLSDQDLADLSEYLMTL